ncbi:hypothetical protein [Desertimonas flava]|uniref:hypothetical protein n=1 Tax=Desertimonas flava TaxID=2064846 RepID=UPI000E34E91F|nr:hypothetical protein [Desertimonas flava]
MAGLAFSTGAGAAPPDGDADGWQELAAMGVVEWGATQGLTLSTPACTQPNSAAVGEAITCYATSGDGTVQAFVTQIPPEGAAFEFAPRPAPTTGTSTGSTTGVPASTMAPPDATTIPAVAPTSGGVQPPAGYPGTETTTVGPTAPQPAPGSEPAAGPVPADSGPAFEQGVDPFPPGEVLDVPVPDTGPDTNFASPTPLGETADLGAGWTMTINSVQTNADADVAANDPEALAAPDGWQYVLLDVTMGYEGDPAPEVQSGVEVFAIGNDVLYSETGYVFYEGVMTFDDVPAPGETVTGHKVFLVPVDAAESLIIFAKSYRAFDLPYTFLATS